MRREMIQVVHSSLVPPKLYTGVHCNLDPVNKDLIGRTEY